ncbi:MAG: regulatory protein GemA [Azonexus sp.]
MSSVGVIRSARIRAIHAACKAQGIDDETRRAMQLQLTGKASSKDMSLSEINAVVDHLNRSRRKTTNEWAFTFDLTPARRLYGQKIYRLAERVGKLMNPPVPVASKAYVEGIAKQMAGATQPLEFCDPERLHKIVQALEIYVKRHGV